MTEQTPIEQRYRDWAESAGSRMDRFLPFHALIRRMTKHAKVAWERAKYDPTPDARVVVDELGDAEALSSLIGVETIPAIPEDSEGKSKPEEVYRRHVVAVDVDVPAWLIPSSTPNHHHLYVEIPGGVLEEAYFAWLDAGAVIGLLEPGYVAACKSRGMTSVRAPWVKKGQEKPPPVEARCGRTEPHFGPHPWVGRGRGPKHDPAYDGQEFTCPGDPDVPPL